MILTYEKFWYQLIYFVTKAEQAYNWLSFLSLLFERVQTVFVRCILCFLPRVLSHLQILTTLIFEVISERIYIYEVTT